MVLALEGRYENFSLGRGRIGPQKMALIWDLAMKHGFRRAPFFFGQKLWRGKDVERIRAILGNSENN
jgi:hypothetical protein